MLNLMLYSTYKGHTCKFKDNTRSGMYVLNVFNVDFILLAHGCQDSPSPQLAIFNLLELNCQVYVYDSILIYRFSWLQLYMKVSYFVLTRSFGKLVLRPVKYRTLVECTYSDGLQVFPSPSTRDSLRKMFLLRDLTVNVNAFRSQCE